MESKSDVKQTDKESLSLDFYIAPDKRFYIIFFLFLDKNICCGYSLEVPNGGTSNEYRHPMFSYF